MRDRQCHLKLSDRGKSSQRLYRKGFVVLEDRAEDSSNEVKQLSARYLELRDESLGVVCSVYRL